GDRVAGSHLAVQDAAFEACRQDVAQHHERLVLDVSGSDVEARVREGDADVFGLRAVDRVAEHPAALGAVGGHPAAAGVAGAVGADARHQDAVTGPDAPHRGADRLHDPDPLVAPHAALGDRPDVALEYVEMGPGDGGGHDPHHRVGGMLDDRPRLLLPGLLARPVVDERLHRDAYATIALGPIGAVPLAIVPPFTRRLASRRPA